MNFFYVTKGALQNRPDQKNPSNDLYPSDFRYLMTFSVCFGVLIGFVCAQYTAQSVLLVFALTFVLVVALTIYAVRTKAGKGRGVGLR